MLVAILADLPFVHRAMKDFGVFQVGVETALGGEPVISGQTTRQRILASGNLTHFTVVEIIPGHFRGNANLPQIVQALGLPSPLPATNQARQQHAGEDANDSNNDEQLYKRESNPFARRKLP